MCIRDRYGSDPTGRGRAARSIRVPMHEEIVRGGGYHRERRIAEGQDRSIAHALPHGDVRRVQDGEHVSRACHNARDVRVLRLVAAPGDLRDGPRSVGHDGVPRIQRRVGALGVESAALKVTDPFLTGAHQMLTSDGRRAEICYVMHCGDPAAGYIHWGATTQNIFDTATSLQMRDTHRLLMGQLDAAINALGQLALDHQTIANDVGGSLSAASRVLRLMVQSGILALGAYLALQHEISAVSYTHLRANETVLDLVCRLLLDKNKIEQPHLASHQCALHITEQWTSHL